MIRKLLLASTVATGMIAMLIPADVSAKSSDEFREALISTCNDKPEDAMGRCIQGRKIVFDKRNADANEFLKGCLDSGAAQFECDAKQRKYWKDLKKMFGL